VGDELPANAARTIQQEAFGPVSAYAESNAQTVGPVQPELVPEGKDLCRTSLTR